MEGDDGPVAASMDLVKPHGSEKSVWSAKRVYGFLVLAEENVVQLGHEQLLLAFVSVADAIGLYGFMGGLGSSGDDVA